MSRVRIGGADPVAVIGKNIWGAWTWTQVYRWLISYITPLSDGTLEYTSACTLYFWTINRQAYILQPTNIHVGLSSLNFFLVGAGIFVHFGEGAFPPFKGIQGHRRWCQSKARMRLPISP